MAEVDEAAFRRLLLDLDPEEAEDLRTDSESPSLSLWDAGPMDPETIIPWWFPNVYVETGEALSDSQRWKWLVELVMHVYDPEALGVEARSAPGPMGMLFPLTIAPPADEGEETGWERVRQSRLFYALLQIRWWQLCGELPAPEAD